MLSLDCRKNDDELGSVKREREKTARGDTKETDGSGKCSKK